MFKRISSATLNYGIGQVIPKVVGFLLLPLYTTYLTPEDFGIADLAVTVSAFIMSVIRLGMPGAIARFYFDYVGSKNEPLYISTLYIGTVIISFVLSVPFLIIGYFLLEKLVPGLPYMPFFILIVVSSFLNTSSEIQRRLLQVREQSAYNAWLNIISTLAGIIVAIILVVSFHMGALGMVVSTLVTSVIFYVQAQFYLKKDLRLAFDRKMFSESLLYGLPLLPYHIMGNFAPVFSKSILSAQGSLAAVGLFAIAFKLTQPMQIFSNALGTAYSPIYFSMRSSTSDKEVREKVKSTFNKIWAISTILFMGIYLFAPPFLIWLTDSRYHSAVTCVKVLSVGFLPTVFYLIVSQEIFYQKKTKIALLINLTAALLNIGLALLLVPTLAEIGLAISMVIPLFISAGWAYYFSNNYYANSLNWQMIFEAVLVVLLVLLIDYFLPELLMIQRISAEVMIFLVASIMILWREKSIWATISILVKRLLKFK